MAFADIIYSAIAKIFDRTGEVRKMALLKEMLHDPRWQWRSLHTLSQAIQCDEDKTRELLNRIGARRASAKLAAALEQFVDGKVALEDEVAAILDLGDRIKA
jgi:hypothetical protein